MIQLPNGCYCSEIKVHPKNWNQPGASLKKPWYIYYRFYDPLSPAKGGKLVALRGMNAFRTLTERREVTTSLIRDELHRLKDLEYNPITGYEKEPEDPYAVDYVVDPNAPIIEALYSINERLKLSAVPRTGMRSVLKYFSQAAAQLRLANMPIKSVRRRHIRVILDQVGKLKGDKWTANNFNFYRSYLMMLFAELVNYDVVETNPVKEIKKAKAVQRIRPVLTEEQRVAIDAYLRKVNYIFWRFMQIFFHSGSREKEILNVQGKDVDLERQEVIYLVKKGPTQREVKRVIKNIALPLWREAMEGCGPEDYVFSRGLRPGKSSIRPEQITRRWRKWVKQAKGPDGKPLFGEVADFYSLKHLNTTEVAGEVGEILAAKHNSHTVEVLKRHYDVYGKDRETELLKSLRNKFA